MGQRHLQPQRDTENLEVGELPTGNHLVLVQGAPLIDRYRAHTPGETWQDGVGEVQQEVRLLQGRETVLEMFWGLLHQCVRLVE